MNNTGNVTLTGVRAEDNLTGAVWTVGTLAPGQNYTNTTRYQVMLSDLPGPLTNQLLVNGTDPCGIEVNASALETVQIQPSCTGVPKVLTVCASGCNFTTIQAAINAACPGDTIEVQSGTYAENVVVNKTLTLQGVDTGAGLPVVDAGGSGDAITISADGCTLKGFVARNSGISGIRITSDGNTISGNTATGNSAGISFYSSEGNIISGNTATNNYNGIFLYNSCSSNIISDNTVTNNYNGEGIYLGYDCSNNTLSDNIVANNYYGITLYYSCSSNTISGNTAIGNSLYGIHLYSSEGNTISGNTVTDSSYGISLYISCSGNTISDNTVNNNHYGIYPRYFCSGNTISGNTATGNIYGIYLLSCSGNSIYLNALDNTNNGWSDGANNWNSTTSITWEHDGRNLTGRLGNIWSDYDGFDCDGDGMGDTPYDKIEGGSEKDYHPIGGSASAASYLRSKRSPIPLLARMEP